MTATALLLTVLSVALLYAASPATPVSAPGRRGALRLAGAVASAAGVGLLAAAMGALEGVLVGLAALMLAASVLVIAVPLVHRRAR